MSKEVSIAMNKVCPECGGEGRKIIGCAMTHALTAPCVNCFGTGYVPSEGRPSGKACPECGGALHTDGDILWCLGCTFSASCAAQPVQRNQHERGIPENLLRAKRLAKSYLADRPDVTGIGIGDNRIRVYLKDDEGRLGIPADFNGVPVECVVTGEIKAFG